MWKFVTLYENSYGLEWMRYFDCEIRDVCVVGASGIAHIQNNPQNIIYIKPICHSRNYICTDSNIWDS